MDRPTSILSLYPVPCTQRLVADMERPTSILLKTYDKHDNACVTGGLHPVGRLTLVKQGTADTTVLMPNNWAVTVDDNMDGTYHVNVAISISATVRLGVSMDKELPGNSSELTPLQLTFVKPAAPTPAAAPALAPAALLSA